MMTDGSDKAVPVVTLSEALSELTVDKPVIVPLVEVSVTLLSPISTPALVLTVSTANVPLFVKTRSPPEKSAARFCTLLAMLRVAEPPAPESSSDGAVMMPVCVMGPVADAVSVPPVAIVEAPKLTAPMASMVAVEADTMLTVPSVLPAAAVR